ncbi:MAG: hypothetical protein LUQ32_08945, partial [Methanomicrobiales archaeon]|nr:hypothetical protein [Methanomicrobiales archaeon]
MLSVIRGLPGVKRMRENQYRLRNFLREVPAIIVSGLFCRHPAENREEGIEQDHKNRLISGVRYSSEEVSGDGRRFNRAD